MLCNGKLWIEDGEVCYAGRNVSMGYCYGMDDLSRGDDNQGILKTGDYGYLDEEGYLYLTGRRNDFVKLFGKRLNLNSIERMADERFGIDIIVRVEGDGIMILYEEECEEKIRPIKDRIRKEIHIPEKCINFKKVAAFKRNRSDRLQRVITSGSSGDCLEIYWKQRDAIRSLTSLWVKRKK